MAPVTAWDRRHWVTRWVKTAGDQLGYHPIVGGTVTLGAVSAGLTAAFLALTASATTPRFIASQILATLVAVIAPAGIWYWETRVFPAFVDDTSDIVEDKTALKAVAETYHRVFRKRSWTFAVPWTALIVAVVVLNAEFFRTVGVAGYADPAFWVYLAFAAWWGLLTGIGFHGALTAILCIRAVGGLAFDIEPLHPDGLGGLSAVGSFAIWTTMLISIGSLTLPLAFLLGAKGGYSALVYTAVAVYVTVIVLSFVYPTVYVNRRAQSIREEILEEKRLRIRTLQRGAADLEEAGQSATGELEGDAMVAKLDEVTKRLEIQRLRDEYTEYASVNLYPMTVSILTRLVSSILMPLFFVLLEAYMGRLL